MAQTPFERYGGFATVRKIVSEFYDKVLESPVVSHHFEKVEMRRLVDHQTKFIASVMGGPAAYTDQVLERVHGPLNITREEFNETTELLRETLEDFDFEKPDIDTVIAEIKRRQEIIIGHG